MVCEQGGISMRNIKLLDCTLRDGGYVNSWKFGHDNLVSIYERLIDAGIDIIEIGFLDECEPFDLNRSIMPDTDSVQKIYGKLDKKQSMIVGMIDYGTCGIENIKPCDESYLDGIRVIFKKHLSKPAMEFCKEIKRMGYKVFAQLVSVTSYTDEELLDFIKIANEIKPYAVSMVDTYGLMHQNDLMHYFNLLNQYLDLEIGLGYHAHNNFQMGYANCIAMLSNNIERLMIVDGTVYGMGKSAGNAPIELIAMHMNNFLGKKYHISQILEAIDVNISQFYSPSTWGYNMFYYVSALNDCHPNYVTYLMNKRTLSIKSINEVLSRLKGEKKLLYDKDYIENLYIEYQKNEVNDLEDRLKLKKILENEEILLVGPGVTMQTQKEKIEEFVRERFPIIISINYVPEYLEPNYIFLSNSKRYVQLATRLSTEKYSVIATSNVTGTNKDAFEYILNFSTLMDKDAEIVDNSLIMLLKILIDLECKNVTLAGFDGYSQEHSNYFNKSMEYDFVKNMAEYLNSYTRDFIEENKAKIGICFLTESKYGG